MSAGRRSPSGSEPTHGHGSRVDDDTIAPSYDAAIRRSATPFLERSGTSQLARLDEATYRARRRRIEAAIRDGEERGAPAVFTADLSLYLSSARRT